MILSASLLLRITAGSALTVVAIPALKAEQMLAVVALTVTVCPLVRVEEV
jgi:hypothetical protein